MARNPVTGEAAQKAIDYIKQAQGQYEAWDYQSKGRDGPTCWRT